MRVLILGAGGHAQVVADVLLRAREAGARHIPVGFLDDDPARVGALILGIPVLGTIAQLEAVDHDGVVPGIGDNNIRARLFHAVRNRDEEIVTAVHPAAVLAPDVSLGAGVIVCAGAVVNTGASIADDVILNTASTVDHHSRVGPHAHIAPGAHLGGGVDVGEGALIGMGATVMPHRAVGAWTIVGAGALVHADLDDALIAAGVPARVVRPAHPEGRFHACTHVVSRSDGRRRRGRQPGSAHPQP